MVSKVKKGKEFARERHGKQTVFGGEEEYRVFRVVLRVKLKI